MFPFLYFFFLLTLMTAVGTAEDDGDVSQSPITNVKMELFQGRMIFARLVFHAAGHRYQCQ